MKSPVAYGNPVMFAPPMRRGKSVEELGDADWAKEQERLAHLQQLHQLHQFQQQQQVGYPGYGMVHPPPGNVMVPSPVSPIPAPGFPMPVHGGMVHPQLMVPVGSVPPPMHVPPQWQVQQAHVRQVDKSNVYYHPGSEDGHLGLRISEWKGKHCFYQGPEESQSQDYSARVQQEQISYENNRFEEERTRRDDWDREKEHSIDRYAHRRYSEDLLDKHREYERRYDDRYDDRDQDYYDDRNYKERDDYYYERRDRYARRDKYSDQRDYDRDYYEPKDRYREQQRERDRYYDKKDSYYDRREDERYDSRDRYDQRGEEAYSKRRGNYESRDDQDRYREKDRFNRYKDIADERREDHYNSSRRRDPYREMDRYEQRDQYDYDREDRNYDPKARDRYRDLRSLSDDSRYEEYPPKDRKKTHCEEWVEQQNKKLAMGDSFEDPGVYRASEDLERGYESSSGGTKRGRRPVYVGSLDRNSFYRKTAPSSLRNSQFATTRKQKKGKYK